MVVASVRRTGRQAAGGRAFIVSVNEHSHGPFLIQHTIFSSLFWSIRDNIEKEEKRARTTHTHTHTHTTTERTVNWCVRMREQVLIWQLVLRRRR